MAPAVEGAPLVDALRHFELVVLNCKAMKPIDGASQRSGFILERLKEGQHRGRVAYNGPSTQIGPVRRGVKRDARINVTHR
jgi:hypothetical protein